MKNNNIGFKVFIALFIGVIVLNILIALNTKKEEITSDYNNIKVSDYVSLLDQNGTHFIYIGRPTCSYCISSQPKTSKVAQELGITINYINTDAESDTTLSLLNEKTEGIYDGSTPIFIVIKDGKILDNHVGDATYEDFYEFFNKYVE